MYFFLCRSKLLFDGLTFSSYLLSFIIFLVVLRFSLPASWPKWGKNSRVRAMKWNKKFLYQTTVSAWKRHLASLSNPQTVSWRQPQLWKLPLHHHQVSVLIQNLYMSNWCYVLVRFFHHWNRRKNSHHFAGVWNFC